MSLKLSRVAHLRDKALHQIDVHYAAKIDAAMGPMASLHLLKRLVPSGALVEDKEDILARAAEQDLVLAAIDNERRALKDAVRAAETAAEIKALIAHMG